MMTRLVDTFSLHLVHTFPRALEKAIYQESRRQSEGSITYIARVRAHFRELKKDGQDLDSVVHGYIPMRHAKLSHVQEDQVKTWTDVMQEPEVAQVRFGLGNESHAYFEEHAWERDYLQNCEDFED